MVPSMRNAAKKSDESPCLSTATPAMMRREVVRTLVSAPVSTME